MYSNLWQQQLKTNAQHTMLKLSVYISLLQTMDLSRAIMLFKKISLAPFHFEIIYSVLSDTGDNQYLLCICTIFPALPQLLCFENYIGTLFNQTKSEHSSTYKMNTQTRSGLTNFFKSQQKIFQVLLLRESQFCQQNTKATMDYNMLITDSCVPIKLCLQKQEMGWI